jgi:sulfatase modifying factor 1
VEYTNSLGMKFRLIPPGEFEMGSSDREIAALLKEANDAGLGKWLGETLIDMGEFYTQRVPAEGPRRTVNIERPFYLGQHEVTVGQFRAFVEASKYETHAELDGQGGAGLDVFKKELFMGPGYTWRKTGIEQDDDHPVVMLSRFDAMEFCRWLGEKETRRVRLPEEFEWEFACRAGSQHRYHGSDDAECLEHAANVADESFRQTWKTAAVSEAFHQWDDGFPASSPAGSFRANAFGLYDMHGNAWEWCAGEFDPNGFRRLPSDETAPPASAEEPVYLVRGGGWDTPFPGYFRNAYRHFVFRYLRMNSGGFRVVLEIPEGGTPVPSD